MREPVWQPEVYPPTPGEQRQEPLFSALSVEFVIDPTTSSARSWKVSTTKRFISWIQRVFGGSGDWGRLTTTINRGPRLSPTNCKLLPNLNSLVSHYNSSRRGVSRPFDAMESGQRQYVLRWPSDTCNKALDVGAVVH